MLNSTLACGLVIGGHHNPTDASHQAAKDSWLAAQEPYGQTEVYRFYGGPIDDQDGPEGLINAWPLDEAYIDYVDGNPNAGIINNLDAYPTISEELVVALNEEGAEENISSGYHSIEFLLWGQDLSADSNGQRPYTDYVEGQGQNAERRAAYLRIAIDRLVFDLESMVTAWDPNGTDNFRVAFIEAAPDESLSKVLTGMGVLAKSELAGERMFVALDNQDQEDEHSCFSDNTHRDIITNFQGIFNVWSGDYARLDGSLVRGTGIGAIVAHVDPELHEAIDRLMFAAVAQTNSIHVPFDQAIVLPEERTTVLETVETLQKIGDQIAAVGAALGYTLNTALP